jgi:hypothetical protein
VEVRCFTGPAAAGRVGIAAATCEDRWVGTSSAIISDFSPSYRIEASVTWTYDPLLSSPPTEAVYFPEGTATFSVLPDLPEPGCFGTITPPTYPISRLNGGQLTVNYETDPPTYSGFGVTLWVADYLLTCPDSSFPIPQWGAGGAWFQATGELGPDGLTIAGTQPNSGQTFTYSFTRP